MTEDVSAEIAALSTSDYNRNGQATVRLSASNLREYTTDGAGDALAGTWRSRGKIMAGVYLFQRVS